MKKIAQGDDAGMQRDYDDLCKVILLGSSDVGKTSLLSRYADGTFSEQRQMTMNFDNKIKKFNLHGREVVLQVRCNRLACVG